MAQATATNDTITIDAAGQLDTDWFNNGMQPTVGLRIVNHYASGGRTVSILEVPGNDATPVYRRVNNHYVHVDGPTLAEWQQEREYAEASREAAELRTWAGGA